jgi:hypothetical protein
MYSGPQYQGPIEQPGAISQSPNEYPPQYQPPKEVNVNVHHIHHYEEESKIPCLSKTWAIIILIINIFLPGWGTIVLGCLSEHHSSYFILIGFLQFLLAGLIIGWIWAIITGVKVLNKSASNYEY